MSAILVSLKRILFSREGDVIMKLYHLNFSTRVFFSPIPLKVPLEVVFSHFEQFFNKPVCRSLALYETGVLEGSALEGSSICMSRKRGRPRKIKTSRQCG